MAQPRRTRSPLATVVGYVLVALIVYFLFHLFVGTLIWLVRTVVVIVVVGGLFVLYLKLKAPKD